MGPRPYDPSGHGQPGVNRGESANHSGRSEVTLGVLPTRNQFDRSCRDPLGHADLRGPQVLPAWQCGTVTELVLMGAPRVAAVSVSECGEDVVDTRELALDSDPDENPQNTVYAFLRRSVAERLLQAQAALPTGLRVLLAEGYRPYEQQEFYFNRRKRRLIDADPMLSEEAALLRASEFVSPPDIAPHVTGAAVDLTLVDEHGEALDMGTPIDARPEDCEGACYFDAANISAEARQNRKTLAAALTGAGFVNYPTEWWHWSYGDRYWALLSGRSRAMFGPLQLRSEAPRDLW